MLVLFDQLHEVAAHTIFKNHPEMVASFIPVVESHNIGMTQWVDDLHLVDHFALPGFIHTFYGKIFQCMAFASLKLYIKKRYFVHF